MENRPFSSVRATFFVPLTVTVAPETGSPVILAITVPVTLRALFCACVGALSIMQEKNVHKRTVTLPVVLVCFIRNLSLCCL
jgi:hypothetical protein